MVTRRQIIAALAGTAGLAYYSSDQITIDPLLVKQSTKTRQTPTSAPPSVTLTTAGIPRQGSWLGLNQAKVEQAAHDKVIKHRNQLQYSNKLANVARYHSWDMARQNYYSHKSPSGHDFTDRYDRFGVTCSGASAENIVKTFAYMDIEAPDGTGEHEYETSGDLGRGIVEEWLQSLGHRNNIMDTRFSRHGIGVWWEQSQQYDGVAVYATQNFC